MNEYSFIIIHGLHGSGPDHWQSWLHNELKQLNYKVAYPTFSSFDNPDKDVWSEELSSVLQTIPNHHKKIVITHSLGGLLWQHFAAAHERKIADHLILVAPPSPKVILPEAKSFFPVPLDGGNLTRSADEILFVHSSNDPYCSMKDVKNYQKLNLPALTFPNMGHINTESGHGRWPWILDLCLKIASQENVCTM